MSMTPERPISNSLSSIRLALIRLATDRLALIRQPSVALPLPDELATVEYAARMRRCRCESEDG